MSTRTVANLTAVISANNTKFKKGLNDSKKQLGVFQKSVNAIGPAILGAFAATKVIDFGKAAFEAAAEAEGIERAFNKLNKPNLLSDLRNAVKGTVSDVRLMQSAVKANNFKIPLEQLAMFFKFAQQRAVETGESVDYLVESITNGIARKSLPILDNLGLSATEVRDEFNKTGDMATAVGNIISRSMSGASTSVLTTKEKVDQLKASFENLKVAIGKRLTGGSGGYGILNVASEDLQKLAEWLDKTPEYLKKAKEEASKFIEALDGDNKVSGITTQLEALNRQLEYSRNWYKIYTKQVDETRGKEKKRNEEFQKQHKDNVYRIYEEIKILQDYLDALNEVNDVGEKTSLPKILSPNEFAVLANEYKSMWLDLGMNTKFFADEEAGIMEDLNAEISAQFKELSGNTTQNAKDIRDSVVKQFRGMHEDASKDVSDLAKEISQSFLQMGSQIATTLGTVAAQVHTTGADMTKVFDDLSSMIYNALGDILLYVGINMPMPAGIPVILAGLAFKGIGAFAGAGGLSRGSNIPGQVYSNQGSGSSTLYGNDIRLANNYATTTYDRIG